VDDQLIRKVVIATGEVTTFAGSVTVYGSADGVGTSARFVYPEGVASDGAGSLFIANSGNQTIRKIDLATGTVTTLAGLPEGDPGSADGTGSDARFNDPRGLACDGADSLFVADSRNDTIRKIDIATGTVTTLAGLAGSPGSADGTGSAARFTYPEGLTSDGAGSLFVADSGNNLLRKVVIATGEVTTLASPRGGSGGPNGPGSVLQFDFPTSVVSDGAGNLYVADSGSYTIRKVVIATGEVTILAGSPEMPGSADGTGTSALFDQPWNLAIDNEGSLFVADRHTIRKIVIATGTVTTVVSTPSQSEVVPGPLPAKLACPAGLAIGPAGDLFITDGCENVVLVAQF
jgi:sugar lactone lactonase YvrE